MTKGRKNLLILLGVLCVLLILVLIVANVNQYREDIDNTDEVVLEFDADEVTALSWTGDSSASLVKSGGEWHLEESEDFPVNQSAVTDLLNEINNYQASYIIKDAENVSDYGLDSPCCSVKISCGDDEYNIYFGDFSTMDSERYFSIGDGNVYLAAADIVEDFSISEEDLIQLDSGPAIAQLKEVKLTGDNNLDIIYKEDAGLCYSDEFLYYLKSGKTYKPLSNSKASTFVDSVANLALTDWVSYNASEDAEKYGLDEPMMKAEVSYIDDNDEDQTFTLDFGTDGKSTYVMVDGSELIYKVDMDLYGDIFETGYDNLRPSEVVLIDWNKVGSMTVEVDGNKADLEISSVSDESLTAEYEGEEVDISEIRDAVTALSYSDFDTDDEEKTEEITVTLNLDSEKYPSVTFTAYRYDGNSCIVKCGDTVGTVERSLVVALKEAVNAIIL